MVKTQLEITIRSLKASDWGAWWALRLVALRDHPDAFGEGWEEAVEAGEAPARQRFITGISGPSRIFGAFASDDTLVGTCGIIQHHRQKMRHRMDIWGMYVAPGSRGTGTGARLVDAAVGHARQVDGVVQVHLAVASHNVAAISIYSRLGFTTYGREPRAMGLPDRFVDEDFMVLLLDTPQGE